MRSKFKYTHQFCVNWQSKLADIQRAPTGVSTLYTRDYTYTKAANFTITTPIFYVNADPHIGHLYTGLIADASSRWNVMLGKESHLITGTDEHGLKIENAAFKANILPQEHCDIVSAKYTKLFASAGIRHTTFIRTTDLKHKKAVEAFWDRISGYVTKGFYSGWYCTNDEAFLRDDQVHEVTDSLNRTFVASKESGQPCEMINEENYVFPLYKFAEPLREWLNSGVIRPSLYTSSLDASLANLGELSVSRSINRTTWGIPVPHDETQTIYVWLDALVNYLTACGFPDHMKNWPVDCHVVGKDILKFHAIYWPAFLMAADLPLPRSILCHAHWLHDGRKMSKSIGNVVSPSVMMDRYTSEGLRYFLLREGTPASDANFSESKMVDYLNAELCNTLGNLLSRVSSQTLNPKQIFPALSQEVFNRMATVQWTELISSLECLPARVREHYDSYNFYKGVDEVMAQLRFTNGFVEQNRPWKLVNDHDALDVILHVVLENLRVSAILLQPIIPHVSNQILNQIGVGQENRMYDDILPLSKKSRNKLITKGPPLYKRIDRSQIK